MVALAILAVASLVLLGSFANSLSLDGLNRESIWAREACRDQAEHLLTMPLSSVLAWNNSTFYVLHPVNGMATTKTEILKPIAGRTAVGLITVDSTAQADARCYKVTVNASWRTGKGETASVSVVVNVSEHM